MLEVRDKIHTDIYSQIPSYFQEEGPVFAELLSAYYQFLDNRNPRNLPAIDDIDSTFVEYLIFYKEKYLKDFPTNRADNNVDIRFLVKHINDLYQRKGSEESLRLLFRMIFNEEIEVFYPSTSILRASNSIWSGVDYLEMRPVTSYDDYPIRKQDIITGNFSGSRAIVNEVIFIRLGNGPLVPIVYVSNPSGNFSVDDTFNILRQNSEFNISSKIFKGSITSATVLKQQRTPGNSVGDEIKLISSNSGIGATGLVSKVAQDITGRIEFSLEDSGWGLIHGEWWNPLSPNLDPTNQNYNTGLRYSVSSPELAPPVFLNNDILISDQVVVLEQSEDVTVKTYDTLSSTNAKIEPIDANNIPLTAPALSFNVGDVNKTTLNQINIPGHGLSTGVPIRYQLGSNVTSIPDLTESELYYLIKVNNEEIKLADSLANAEAGTAISLSNGGQLVSYSSTASVISADGNVESGAQIEYTTATSHGFSVGEFVTVTGATDPDFNISSLEIVSVTSTTFNIVSATPGLLVIPNGLAQVGVTTPSLLQCVIAYYPDVSADAVAITDIEGYPTDSPFINTENGDFYTQAKVITGVDHGLQANDIVNIASVVPNGFNVANAIVTNVLSTTAFTYDVTFLATTTYLQSGTVSKVDSFLTEISGSGTILGKEGQIVYFQADQDFPELPDNGKVKIDFVDVAKNPVNNVTTPDITVTRIAPKNSSAHFDISVTNEETVTLVTDIIDDVVDTPLVYSVTGTDFTFSDGAGGGGNKIQTSSTDLSQFVSGTEITISGTDNNNGDYTIQTGFLPNELTITGTFTYEAVGDTVVIESKEGAVDYGFSGTGAENYNTTLADAFEIVDLTVGRVSEIFVRSNGFDYQSNALGVIRQNELFNFGKRDLIIEFTLVNFNLNIGDQITQERTIENLRYDPTDPATGDPTILYTVKAEYLRRNENRFYFRQTSFFDFDSNLPIVIQGVSYGILSIQRDLDSNPLGGNAFVQGDAKFLTGQIEEVTVSNTGFRYTDDEIVTVYSAEDEDNFTPLALTRLSVDGNGKGGGSWKTKSAFLSESTRALHDNNYYQEYSYDISSRIPPEDYENLIENTVGVAGTKQFTSPLINTNNNTPTDLDVELNVFDISTAIIQDNAQDSNNGNTLGLNTFIADPSTYLISTGEQVVGDNPFVANVVTLNTEIDIAE